MVADAKHKYAVQCERLRPVPIDRNRRFESERNISGGLFHACAINIGTDWLNWYNLVFTTGEAVMPDGLRQAKERPEGAKVIVKSQR
jgi:hypothetical protein